MTTHRKQESDSSKELSLLGYLEQIRFYNPKDESQSRGIIASIKMFCQDDSAIEKVFLEVFKSLYEGKLFASRSESEKFGFAQLIFSRRLNEKSAAYRHAYCEACIHIFEEMQEEHTVSATQVGDILLEVDRGLSGAGINKWLQSKDAFADEIMEKVIPKPTQDEKATTTHKQTPGDDVTDQIKAANRRLRRVSKKLGKSRDDLVRYLLDEDAIKGDPKGYLEKRNEIAARSLEKLAALNEMVKLMDQVKLTDRAQYKQLRQEVIGELDDFYRWAIDFIHKDLEGLESEKIVKPETPEAGGSILQKMKEGAQALAATARKSVSTETPQDKVKRAVDMADAFQGVYKRLQKVSRNTDDLVVIKARSQALQKSLEGNADEALLRDARSNVRPEEKSTPTRSSTTTLGALKDENAALQNTLNTTIQGARSKDIGTASEELHQAKSMDAKKSVLVKFIDHASIGKGQVGAFKRLHTDQLEKNRILLAALQTKRRPSGDEAAQQTFLKELYDKSVACEEDADEMERGVFKLAKGLVKEMSDYVTQGKDAAARTKAAKIVAPLLEDIYQQLGGADKAYELGHIKKAIRLVSSHIQGPSPTAVTPASLTRISGLAKFARFLGGSLPPAKEKEDTKKPAPSSPSPRGGSK